MKKILLSTIVALNIACCSLYANDDSGFYVGLGYASTNVDFDLPSSVSGIVGEYQKYIDASTDSVLFLAGYDINPYIGIEGRYYLNVSSIAVDYKFQDIALAEDYEAESFAIYLKPRYNLGPITAYALAGATVNEYTATAILGAKKETLFSWGVGAKLNITDDFNLFADYTDFGENDDVLSTGLTSWNVGISLRF